MHPRASACIRVYRSISACISVYQRVSAPHLAGDGALTTSSFPRAQNWDLVNRYILCTSRVPLYPPGHFLHLIKDCMMCGFRTPPEYMINSSVEIRDKTRSPRRRRKRLVKSRVIIFSKSSRKQFSVLSTATTALPPRTPWQHEVLWDRFQSSLRHEMYRDVRQMTSAYYYSWG